jgi:hypothetical protein
MSITSTIRCFVRPRGGPFSFVFQQPPSQSRQISVVRGISASDAKRLLGFGSWDKPTVPELRAAYFEAAKQTHPDMLSGDKNTDAAASGFRNVTQAYERLLHSPSELSDRSDDDVEIISQDEEERYRTACLDFLGIPAEIVEESKQNPMFRRWLGGNTDAAEHWRSFFASHGGLAQKLRPPSGYLGVGLSERPGFETRPRRKRK